MRKYNVILVFVLAVFMVEALSNSALASRFAGCGYAPTFWSANKSLNEIVANLSVAHPEDDACAYYFLGTLLHFRGDPAGAIQAYQKSLKSWPDYGDVYEMMGDAYAALGKEKEAVTSYRKAESLPPDTWRQLSSRCWVRAVRGTSLDRALTDCIVSVQESGGDLNALQSRCFVYYRMQFYDEAIRDCATASATNSRFSDALYVKGLAEIAKGDNAKGQADIKLAIDADYRIEEVYALYGIKAP